MLTLLQTYSLSEILTILVAFALGAKGVISFFDWGYSRLKSFFNKEQTEITKEKQIQEKLEKESKIIKTLQQEQRNTDEKIEQLTQKINLLIDSDRDDIRAAITKEHHYFCYKLGWIDDFSLDCLERRFKHYSDEGGNSFIEGFMEDLRKLPRNPEGVLVNK